MISVFSCSVIAKRLFPNKTIPGRFRPRLLQAEIAYAALRPGQIEPVAAGGQRPAGNGIGGVVRLQAAVGAETLGGGRAGGKQAALDAPGQPCRNAPDAGICGPVLQPAGGGPGIGHIDAAVRIHRQSGGIARQVPRKQTASLAAGGELPACGVHRPDAAAAQIGDIQGLAVGGEGQARRSGDAAHHPPHGAACGVIGIDPAGGGVADQLGPQGLVQAAGLGAKVRRLGKIDLSVGAGGHRGGIGQTPAVDLGDDLFGGGAPAVVGGAAEGPALPGQDGVPDVARRVKGKRGDPAFLGQHRHQAAAVLPHPQQGAALSLCRPGRQIDPAVPHLDAVGGLVALHGQGGGVRNGLPARRRGGGRQGVALRFSFDGAEPQRIDQGGSRQDGQHRRRDLKPVQDKIPPGPALRLPGGTAAGVLGPGGPGLAGPAVHPGRHTGPKGQHCDQQHQQKFCQSKTHGVFSFSLIQWLGVRPQYTASCGANARAGPVLDCTGPADCDTMGVGCIFSKGFTQSSHFFTFSVLLW